MDEMEGIPHYRRVKLDKAKRIMEKLELEIYYNFNMRLVLDKQSDPFLTDLELFLDTCTRERAQIDEDGLDVSS